MVREAGVGKEETIPPSPSSVEDVVKALGATSAVPAAGFHLDGRQEYLVRGLGRARSPADLASTALRERGGIPLRLGQIATVTTAPEPPRGTASYRGKPAVILSVRSRRAPTRSRSRARPTASSTSCSGLCRRAS